MKTMMTNTGAILFITFFLTSCVSNSGSNDNAKQDSIVNSDVNYKKSKVNSELQEKLTFHIPPPSGPGSGVCQVTLTIDNVFLLATETCGGHDENGHTESTEKLFHIEFKRDFRYKVSELINTEMGSSFGCSYFEFKGNKLYLYDENKKIINDWLCTYGNIENREDNLESCDCIFLPSEN